MIATVLSVLVALGFCAYGGWRLYGMFGSPNVDIPRIKSHIEGAGAKVVDIQRTGMMAGGRSGPDYRLYNVTINDVLKGQTTRTIGVPDDLLGDAELRDFSRSYLSPRSIP